MTEKDSAMNVHAPTFKWEWNISTIATILGFIMTIGAMAYAYAEFRTQFHHTEQRVTSIRAEHDVFRTGMQRIDQLEYRMGLIEGQMRDSLQSTRNIENAINGLASDLRLTREVLERLERNSN